MRGLFQARKPRGFHHTYIYYDERREWRKRYEQNTPDKEQNDVPHLQRGIWTRKTAARSKPHRSMPFCVVALAVLAWILYTIIKGTCIL